MTSQIRHLVQKYYDMWNDGDFEKADALMHPDIHFRGALGFDMDGIDEFKSYAREVTHAFPGLYHATEIVVCEGERAAVYVLYTGSQKGKLFDIEPTGKRISYNGATFFTLDGNKFSRIRVLGDRYTLYEQLGLRNWTDSSGNILQN